MEEDELLDLVDDTDTVIGTIRRSEYDRMEREDLGNIRAVEMFIENDEGKLWIPTRTAYKKIAPNGLDYSMGGHVGAGEDYLEAGLREIQEELNLTLKQEDLQFVRKFPPTDIKYFRSVYIYRSNKAPDYNKDDYVGAEWLSPQEILHKLDEGVPAKASLRETVEALVRSRSDETA